MCVCVGHCPSDCCTRDKACVCVLAIAPVTVVSQPNRRYTESVQIIPELLKLGKHLVEFTVYIHVPHLHTCTHTHKNC